MTAKEVGKKIKAYCRKCKAPMKGLYDEEKELQREKIK
jgi:hypothetical protein